MKIFYRASSWGKTAGPRILNELLKNKGSVSRNLPLHYQEETSMKSKILGKTTQHGKERP